MNWTERAACYQTPGFASDNPAHTSWCHGCPVVNECAEWAHGEKGFTGVAAGRWWRNGKIQRRPRIWTEAQLLRAHARYGQGRRDDDTLAGQREYDRRRAAARRAGAA